MPTFRPLVAPRWPALAGLLLAGTAFATDWPCLRGPAHDGVSPDTRFSRDFQRPPPLLWKRELGAGFSSFAIAGRRIYTSGTRDRKQVVYCLDRATGTVLWEVPIEPEQTDPDPLLHGPRATPTFDSGRVYMLGAHGRLVCLDADTGSLAWERRFSARPNWGYAGSVLVEGNLAIVSAGRDDGALLALDKATGRTAWKCAADMPGYATPYPFTFDGRRYVCGFLADAAVVADLASGREVLRIPWPAHSGVNASSPIFHDGCLFLSTGYGHGCGLFRLSSGKNGLEARPVWRNKALKNKFQTPVLHEGRLYTSDERALKCVDFLTGRTQWMKGDVLMNKGYKHGTVILAGGQLVILTESGELLVAPATPEAFRPTARARVLEGRCWTIPVLLDGRLYARNHTTAVCLDLSAPSAGE
jgi:glucose dehydrogenase